jgi:hypothetical protein
MVCHKLGSVDWVVARRRFGGDGSAAEPMDVSDVSDFDTEEQTSAVDRWVRLSK